MRIGPQSLPLRRTGDSFTFDIPEGLAFVILKNEIRVSGNRVERQHSSMVSSFKDIHNIARTVIDSDEWYIAYDVIDYPLVGQVLETICFMPAILLNTNHSTFRVQPWIKVLYGWKRRASCSGVVMGSQKRG